MPWHMTYDPADHRPNGYVNLDALRFCFVAREGDGEDAVFLCCGKYSQFQCERIVLAVLKSEDAAWKYLHGVLKVLPAPPR